MSTVDSRPSRGVELAPWDISPHFWLPFGTNGLGFRCLRLFWLAERRFLLKFPAS